jgi:hypothetical protein
MLFLASQFVDILWATLVILDIEKVRIIEGFTKTAPLDCYYMPYSHSLTANVAWAFLVGWLGSLIWDRRAGLVLGACVLLHWFLDLLVHIPDLPLVGDRYKVGFGLWNAPVAAFLLEAVLLLGGVWLYTREAKRPAPFWIFAGVLLVIQASGMVLPLPHTPAAFAATSLANYFVLAAIAGVIERKWG